MLKATCIAAAIVLGTAAIANGAFMLVDPDGNPILVDQHVPKPAN